MSLLSSDEKVFSYAKEHRDGFTEIEWKYVHTPFRKLFHWSPKLQKVTLQSERNSNDQSMDRSHQIRKSGTGTKISYNVIKTEEEGEVDLEKVVDLHPKATKSRGIYGDIFELNSTISALDSEKTNELKVESETTDGSGTNPLHSGYARAEEETTKYKLSGHTDQYMSVRKYTLSMLDALDFDPDSMSPNEEEPIEALEAETLIEDTWREARETTGNALNSVSERCKNAAKTIGRDVQTYWNRLVTDEIIEGYHLEPEEFLDFVESSDPQIEEIEYRNDYEPVQEASRTANTFKRLANDPKARLRYDDIEVLKKETVNGVEYHGKVFFETQAGENTDGSIDWVKGDDPDIEIRLKVPENYVPEAFRSYEEQVCREKVESTVV